MTRRCANFKIEGCTKDDVFVLIRDLGPWDKYPTVTNDAEGVISRMLADGSIKPGQRLLYRDSEGNIDELLIKDGRFDGFSYGAKGITLDQKFELGIAGHRNAGGFEV